MALTLGGHATALDRFHLLNYQHSETFLFSPTWAISN